MANISVKKEGDFLKRKYTLILLILWTLILILSLIWSISLEKHSILTSAKATADAEINKDILYRRWNATHGGVYAPVTENTQPNPYLTDVKLREIYTHEGKEYTLINPAYMTRQVHELGLEKDGIRGHITSLNPIRPQNKADDWEVKALSEFEKGNLDYFSVEIIEGEEYLRYMKPLVTEEGCLKCHAKQGYQTGDIRGGISVSIPMKPYNATAYRRLASIAGTHGLLWILGMIGILLTDRKIHSHSIRRFKAEEKSIESENKFRSIIDQSNDAIFIRFENKIDFVNPRFLDLLKISKDFALSKKFNLIKFVIDDHKEIVESCLKSLLEGKKSHCYVDYDIIDNHGNTRSIQASASIIKYKNRDAILVILREVTEQKILEEQLRQSQKIESIGHLAGGIAHDFNNLLTPIIGNSELALLDLKEDTKYYKEFKEIHETAIRASELTRQILAFSRKQVLNVKVLDLNVLIKNFQKILLRTIGEDVQIDFNYGELYYSVRVDASQIEQILLNLCVNAQDAMPDGGSILIETAEVYLDEEYTGSHAEVKPGEYVMMAVTDSGVGIDDVTVQKIFDPFFTTKEVDQGTGLGLSTVYGIVKQHEGYIWVYSEPNNGTCFKLYFPAYESDKNSEVSKTNTIKPFEGNSKILIVEDEEQVRIMIKKILERFGYQVITASNGEEAEKILLEQKVEIDLLLTDVIMPGINGFELYERIKKLIPDTKVVYMSGYTHNAIKRKGITSSEIDLVQKPIMIGDLLQKLSDSLNN